MEEEEEMWFNEDDDFDDNDTVLPATNDILTKKLDTDLESIGKIIEKKQPEANGPKINNNSSQKTTVLNNNANAASGQPTANVVSSSENKSQLFKRVCIFFISTQLVIIFYKPSYVNNVFLIVEE